MTHPYLSDPRRRKAFDDLLANPIGNYREWASRWDWTVARVQRFVKALEKYELITVTKNRWGTVIRSRYGSDSEAIQKRTGTDTEPILLGSKPEIKTDLEIRSIENVGENKGDYGATLCDRMNAELRELANYKPVHPAQPRTAQAIRDLKSAGVPLDFALKQLSQSCVLFNPSKHGRGRPPGTLGYFERGILKAWKAEQKAQQLPLIPTVSMHVERGDVSRVPKYPPPPVTELDERSKKIMHGPDVSWRELVAKVEA